MYNLPDNFTIRNIKMFYGFSDCKPLVAKYIKNENYLVQSEIEKIVVHTNSEIPISLFKVQLYYQDINGKPSGLIIEDDVYGIAEKGRKDTVVDLSQLNIQIPIEGFFVSVGWYKFEINEFQYSYIKSDKKRYVRSTYEPSFGAYPSYSIGQGFIYENNNWVQIKQNKLSLLKKYQHMYPIPAIDVVIK